MFNCIWFFEIFIGEYWYLELLIFHLHLFLTRITISGIICRRTNLKWANRAYRVRVIITYLLYK